MNFINIQLVNDWRIFMEISKVSRVKYFNNYSPNKNDNSELQTNEKIDMQFQLSNKAGENLTENNNDESKKYSEKDLKDAVDVLDKLLEKNKSHVEYERHEVFNDLMIKIVNDKTGEVVTEVPPKKILDMVAKMCELVGVLVDKKA
jgi:flagellar protein FlaG